MIPDILLSQKQRDFSGALEERRKGMKDFFHSEKLLGVF